MRASDILHSRNATVPAGAWFTCVEQKTQSIIGLNTYRLIFPLKRSPWLSSSPGLTWWFSEVVDHSSYFSVPQFSAIWLRCPEVHLLIQGGSWNIFCWGLLSSDPQKAEVRGRQKEGCTFQLGQLPQRSFLEVPLHTSWHPIGRPESHGYL